MIIENIVCLIVGILIGYVAMYVADYKLTRIKEREQELDCKIKQLTQYHNLRKPYETQLKILKDYENVAFIFGCHTPDDLQRVFQDSINMLAAECKNTHKLKLQKLRLMTELEKVKLDSENWRFSYESELADYNSERAEEARQESNKHEKRYKKLLQRYYRNQGT